MIRKILVPVDGSDHGTKAVETACDIASKYDATVYLIHVCFISHLTALSSRTSGEAALEALIDQVEETAEEIIKEAERNAKGKGVEVAQTYVTQGDPADEILKFAKRKYIDTIIMGSHGAGGAERPSLGSVSHKVCNMAECTCITVK